MKYLKVSTRFIHLYIKDFIHWQPQQRNNYNPNFGVFNVFYVFKLLFYIFNLYIYSQLFYILKLYSIHKLKLDLCQTKCSIHTYK